MLSVNEVCEKFYVTPQTVYRWKKEGAPLINVGRRVVCEDYDALKGWWKSRYQQKGDK